MKKLLILSMVCMALCPAFSQSQNAAKLTRSVADYILANTTYKFIDNKTKAVYDSVEQAPALNNLNVQSIYNSWQYSNGVMAIGMMELSKTLNTDIYTNYVGKNVQFLFKNIPHFEALYQQKQRPEFNGFFRLDRLDDCGAMSAALTRYNELSPKKEYAAYLQRAAAYVSGRQTRFADGTFNRDEPRVMTLWADDLYMSVPFLAARGRISGDKKYTNDAIKQVLNFNKYLYNTANGLYFHTWYSDIKTNGVAHWLRCNGWLAMAQAELIDELPANHPKRKELINLLLRQIIGFSRYQDPSGLWHQVVDKPDSYLETSGTAMFIYVVAKAVNEGWIPDSYLSIADLGWKGLSSKVTADGQIQDVCIGTGIADNIAFYYNRPTLLNDFHAAGAFLLAGSEIIKSERKKNFNSPSQK